MIDIQKIKSNISCVDYAQRIGLPIRKSGDRCVSPLRVGASNKTSFIVYDDFWFDHGSGIGGDVVELCSYYAHNGNRGDAIRELARLTGVTDVRTTGWMEYTHNMNAMTAHYHEALTDDDRTYLQQRGLTTADIDRLMIGHVTDGDLRGRLFLPYFSSSGDPYVCYYATRAMPGGAYPDSKYRKQKIDEHCQHIPWGLQTLNREGDTLIIAEGYFDAVSFECQGYPVISAITGRFSKDQLTTVVSVTKKYDKVLIVYDNDARTHAGENFTKSMAKILFKHKIPFIVGKVPGQYKDVSEYYADGGKLSTIIDNARPGMPFLAQQCETLEELKNFIFSVNRFTSETVLASIIEACADKFTQRELNALQKEATKAPTESMIADEIIKKHNVIYIDKVGFYEWDNKRWCKISDAIIKNYADTLYDKQFSTAQRITAVCNLLKGRTLREIVFDRKPVVTFQNGTLEVDTGVFRDFSELDYCSICMEYDYDPHATCPTWKSFIQTITNDEPISAETLQFIGGYVLFPDCKHQKVFILMGDGGNGKSVYLEILQKIFGDENVTHIEPNGLTQEFQRIRLKDSLINIGADINSDFSRGEIREWLLKIADGTTIQACYKGMTHVDFIPRCKLIYACNQMPTADVVNGLNRRFQFVNFPCKFVENPDPDDPLQHERDINIIPKLLNELPGIFNWFYEGYKTLTTVGYFSDTPDQTDMLKLFETVSNPVSVFCEDYVFRGTMTRDEIYCWYKEWCENTGHKPLARERFLPKFREQIKDVHETRTRIDGITQRVFVFGDK